MLFCLSCLPIALVRQKKKIISIKMGKPQPREVNKTSPRKSIAKIGIELKCHISPVSEHYIKCHLLQNKNKPIKTANRQ